MRKKGEKSRNGRCSIIEFINYLEEQKYKKSSMSHKISTVNVTKRNQSKEETKIAILLEFCIKNLRRFYLEVKAHELVERGGDME